MEANHANTRLVIGIAGRIGSGKSEVAHLLERQFRFQYLRYSLILAEWQKRDPEAKSELQRIGWEVMSGPLQIELNYRLIQRIDRQRDCAVDGLRHLIDYDSLQKQFSANFKLIFVEAPDMVRFERLRQRFSTYEEFVAADSHPVESKIGVLKAYASAEISGTLHPRELMSKLGFLLAEFRSMRHGGA